MHHKQKDHPFFSSEHELCANPHWQCIGKHHHHGIALPLSALRNPLSAGIGEFLDLIPLIEWCTSINFDVIQLLPLNDSGGDPSPYSAHSAQALHPIYLSINKLPSLELFDELELPTNNDSQRVAYHDVLHKKQQFLRKYFQRAFPLIRDWPAFHAFVHDNPWLEGYAIYKTLKEQHQERPWWQWEETLKNPSADTLQSLKKELAQEIHYHQCVQFLCFEQMRMVKEIADKEGVFIKGDIPILLNRDSADVWLQRHLFVLDFAAGAPPDMYNEEGQYWGFPLYNWHALEETGYEWWKTRLSVAQGLYHLYRLDHIVGFFKIWAIPLEKKAKEGFFLPQDERLWIPQGETILKVLLGCCNMLPIGEDLGAVPPSVRYSLKHLGICGTKVLRWERHWETDRSFVNPHEFHPLSMSSVSTHDSETLAQWWKLHPDEASLLARARGYPWHDTLEAATRKQILEECHTSSSLFHINLLGEYLAMFPDLVWDSPEDERINIPGLVLDSNWTYRFKPTLHEIVTHKKLASFMKALAHKALTHHEL